MRYTTNLHTVYYIWDYLGISSLGSSATVAACHYGLNWDAEGVVTKRTILSAINMLIPNEATAGRDRNALMLNFLKSRSARSIWRARKIEHVVVFLSDGQNNCPILLMRCLTLPHPAIVWHKCCGCPSPFGNFQPAIPENSQVTNLFSLDKVCQI